MTMVATMFYTRRLAVISLLRTIAPLLILLGMVAALSDTMPRAAAQSSLRTSFRNYAHQAWRVQDGTLPSAPNATVQTNDGYLWVGTNKGLLRFDGLRFTALSELVPNVDDPMLVFSLVASADGGLFIGTDHGVGRWYDHHFHWTDLNCGRINAMLE